MISLFRSIRWALMIEIVLTQVAIAVILEIFRKDKPITSRFERAAKRRLVYDRKEK